MKTLYIGSALLAALGLPLAMEADGYSRAFTDVAERFGLWAALTVFLVAVVILTAWLRERRMAKRIDDLENKFVAAVAAQKDMQAAITLQTKALEELIAGQRGQTDVLKEIKTVFSMKTCPFKREE